MADETKPVEVPKEETPATTEATPAPEAPATEAKEETAAPAAEAAKEATEAPAAEETAAAPAEEAKEEAKPVEDGQLEHKGSNFPKNFIYSKKFFWFGSEAVDPKKIPGLLKDHHLASWASETGKGLLFFTEKGTDKTAPSSAILLADAAEPTTEGSNKFVLSSKGHKHTFKAATLAERDNWVAQLKLKIAEAKELAETIKESEQYKATLASFTPAKKEEKVEDKKTEEAPKAAEEAPAAEAAAETTEAPAAEAPKEEAKEEPKEEDRKRSASRKRTSIFGAFLGGNKKEAAEKKPEATKEEPLAEAEAEAEAPATETPAAAEGAEAPKEPEAEAAAEGETKTKEVKPAEKPTPSKRTSIFGGLPFGKKKVEDVPPATPAKDTPEVAETAPVIPKPEATEPLSTEVAAPAEGEAAAAEATPAPAVNGEKKELKADKRKSSFPFAFGKKAEAGAAAPAEGEAASPDGEKKNGAFSKFRATIKGKGKADKSADKAEEKPADAAEEAKPAEEDKPAEEAAAATEEAKPAEEAAPAAEPAAEETTEAAKDAPVASTPAVTATA